MSVAKSYARALLEAAVAQKAASADLDQIEGQLNGFAQMMRASKEARFALAGPATSAKDKVALVREFAKRGGFTPLVANFLQLMARKERLGIFTEVADAFGAVRLDSEGGLQGRLVSADPVSAADVASLAQSFSQKLGKRVAFKTATDANLLAGIKVTVNGVTYDGTLRSQLQRLRERLVYGATH
jgi:F-type H+-transporting ATPase subunit delta